MKKVVAVIRTLVLLVVLVMALISTPFEVFGSSDSMVAVKGIRALVRATWLAIFWIALETGIGWLLALRKPKAPKSPAAAAAAKEPAAKSPAAAAPAAPAPPEAPAAK
jgi:hypothetical protein